jgi:hypothetical protein
MSTTYAWEFVFQDAVHEADPTIAEIKLRQAEVAIFNRIRHFSARPGSTEEQALFDALVTIRLVRSVRRNVPWLTDAA